jgi:hypothetical protein
MNQGGTGHMLFIPYFSAQNSAATMLSITNTDIQNGKVVKVRFRGAANSDDVLDFTIYMSPGDVWTGTISRDDATGFAKLTTTDTTCTRPTSWTRNADGSKSALFSDVRLPSYIAADARASHTREGYVEILNMADVPQLRLASGPTAAASGLPAVAGVNPLWTAIKHVNGVAPCTEATFVNANLTFANGFAATPQEAGSAYAAGLSAPTGQLMSSWTVMNQANLTAYSGAATAVRAEATVNGVNVNGYALMTFSPQYEAQTNLSPFGVQSYTADPLLRGLGVGTGAVAAFPTWWYDLPDMSSPMETAPIALGTRTTGISLPVIQARDLSNQLSKSQIINEYILTSDGVTMDTDWVISQPTRRYFAAVNYTGASNTAAIWWNRDIDDAAGATGQEVINGAAGATTTTSTSTARQFTGLDNRYNVLGLSSPFAGMGPYACLNGKVSAFNREEVALAGSGEGFSPPRQTVAAVYCGEVGVMQFGSGVLGAAVSVQNAGNMPGATGWAQYAPSLAGGLPLPIVGYAALYMRNDTTLGNFGGAMPHRW